MREADIKAAASLPDVVGEADIKAAASLPDVVGEEDDLY